ncbi:Npun_F0494 family protein [Cyanobacterium sp. uoEpiScrs1]|uniref:Npun_F0494 family protein n=1 Tax=Cyanobacterium sp. uoEpiScrs1 TaxID=2976343 RepID=UPI00226A82B6|nr:Npun_F0494 family protein [Cyanobacterium sp. uoEpiScrs1]
MTVSSTRPLTSSDIKYSSKTLKRAERALSCTPFKLSLFIAMRANSVSLSKIAQSTSLQEKYTQKFLSEQKIERDLIWLINVGILRREVDGQGITDSFRLTPLGRMVIAKWESQEKQISQPSYWNCLLNRLTRWFRLFLF